MKRLLSLLTLCLFACNASAIGGAPAAGWYVPYSQIPVVNYDKLALWNCLTLEPSANCQNTLFTHSTAGMTAPQTITTPGTYTGLNLLSTSSGTCALTINSSGSVVVTDGTFAGPGNLICNTGTGLLELGHSQGFSTSATPGQFYTGPAAYIHDSVMNDVWGIYIYQGNYTGTTAPEITYNFGYNITNGGVGDAAHFLQFNQVAVPCAQVSYNTVINAPYYSHVEDNMNFINAPATTGCPATISYNHILGGYALDPATQTYSGGGIIIDGSSGDTSTSSTQNYNITNNVVLETSNYGIAAAAGFNLSVTDNIAVNDGVFGGGIPTHGDTNMGLVGIYSYNAENSPVFNGSTISFMGNQIYWWDVLTGGDNGVYYGPGGTGCNGGYGSPSCTNSFYTVPGDTIAGRLALVSSILHPLFGSF